MQAGPSTSTNNENDTLTDITRKIHLIQTVLRRCENLTRKVTLGSGLAATMFLTNESSEKIYEAMKVSKVKELDKLKETYQELKTKIDEANIQSYEIRNILYKHYVRKRCLLNLKTLYKELEKYKVSDLQIEILKSRGFVWRKLSGDKCILVEDPEVQAKRIKYLLDVKKLRDQNRTFMYVDEKEIPANESTLAQFQLGNHHPSKTGSYLNVKIAVSPQTGLINLEINNTSKTMAEWIVNDIAPSLKPKDVLVIDENMIKEKPIKEPPKPEAKKEDMIEWLKLNTIPCTSEMHRADLYELIDMFRDKIDKKYPTEEILKGRGLEVLKRPSGWPLLNFFEKVWKVKPLWQHIVDGDIDDVLAKRLELAVNTRSYDTWNTQERDLEKSEMDIFDQDMELEEVVDKLLTMAKDVDMSGQDLPNIWEVKSNDLEKCVNMFTGTW